MLTNITPQTHVSGLSGDWKVDFHNHGRIKLSKNDIEEYEKGKFRLKERRISEIASVFSELKTVYFPDTTSPFQHDRLSTALQKARQLMYKTHLQVSNSFNKLNPDFFGLDESRILVPAFINSQNKTESIDIHTEGGKGVRKTQALTYMPSSIRGMLTLYKLFGSGLQMFDNRTLVTRKFDLENVTITDMNPNQLPVVFMADGEGGTAHSAVVSKDENDNSERMIWTIIINRIGKKKIS